MQGQWEETIRVLQLMEAEGIELNLIMLNMLMNAFGVAGKYEEALSIYHLIDEMVNFLVLQMPSKIRKLIYFLVCFTFMNIP